MRSHMLGLNVDPMSLPNLNVISAFGNCLRTLETKKNGLILDISLKVNCQLKYKL